MEPPSPLPPSPVQRCRRWFESLSPLHAALFAGFLAWAITTLLYAPPFWMPLAGGGPSSARIDDFIKMCRNPLARDLFEPILAYRITTPALAWALGLRGFSGVILQYSAIVATLCIVFHVMAKRTDRLLALWTTVGVAVTYTIIWTNTKPGFPDAVTHLAVAVTLLSTSPIIALIATVFGTLNDERFVLAIPFVLLWFADEESFFVTIRNLWKLALGFATGLAIALAFRHALTVGWIGSSIVKPQVYNEIQTLAWSPWLGWKLFFINTVLANRAMWLVLLAWTPGRLVSIRNWTDYACLLALLFAVAASTVVADVSRSIGFAFPWILIGMAKAFQDDSRFARRLCSVSVILCILTPAFYFPGKVQWHRPLPLSIYRASSGWDLMDLIRK